MKDTVQNQSYLRRINQKTILSYLMKERMSCSDIAKKMKLSNTAIAKITEELVKNGILIKNESEAAEVGRRPLMLEINPSAGVVSVINLAKRQISADIYDLSGKIIDSQKKEIVNKITKCDIEALAEMLKSSYGQNCGRARLLSICIAAPGKIDPVTGNFLIAHRFADACAINLKKIFSAYFDCEILIHNDIKLALEGERIYGKTLTGIKNALMLHIGYSVGSALMLGEKIYGGSHGFAGEITGFAVNAAADGDMMFFGERQNCLDAVSAEGIVKIYKNAPEFDNAAGKECYNIKDMAYAYKSGNGTAIKIFTQAADIWAKTIASIAEFIDLEAVIITGDIIKFGDDFINIISNYVNSKLKYQDVKVCYSELGEECVISGAFNTAVISSLNTLLKDIK